MKFSYILNGIGWAEVFFEVDGKSLYFGPSYLTEPLTDLVDGLLNIIPGCIPEDELRQCSSFEWNSEPGGSVWSISLVGHNQLKIYIEGYQDLFNKNDEARSVELDIVCDLNIFVEQVVTSLEIMMKKYGFVGYRQTWYTKYDFPISGYLRLKYYLQNRTKYPTEHLKEDGYIEFERSNLKEELTVLLSLLDK